MKTKLFFLKKLRLHLFSCLFLFLLSSAAYAQRIVGPAQVCPNSDNYYSFESNLSEIIYDNDYFVKRIVWSNGKLGKGAWYHGGGYISVDVTYQNMYSFHDQWTETYELDVLETSVQISDIKGPTYLSCGSTAPITYSVTPINNAVFYWTPPPGWSGNSNTNVITVTPSGTTAGKICVHASVTTPECGAITSNTSCLDIAIRTLPVPVFINPTTFISLPAGNTQTYSISPVSEASSYTWTTTSGVSILSGQGTTIVSCQFSNPGTFNISVTAVNSCGQGPAANVRVAVCNSSSPPEPGPISWVNTGCEFLFSINPIYGVEEYEWSTDRFNTVNETTGVPEFWFLAFLPKQKVSVRCRNACGVSPYKSVTVFCDERPYSPYRQRFSEQADGKIPIENEVRIFPNQTKDFFTVSLPAYEGTSMINIFSVDGQMVKKLSTHEKSVVIEASDLAPGIYCVQVKSLNFNEVKKLLVTQ